MLYKKRYIYLSILPYALVIGGFSIYLMGSNLFLSFTNMSGRFSFAPYLETFQNSRFWGAGVNTIIWTISSVLGQMALGLSIALLLIRIKKGAAFYRTVLIVLPWATADVVAALLWQWMYNSMYGVINDVFVKIHIFSSFIPWLGQPSTAMLAVVIANIWKGYPISAMFYLAGLQQIPNELYEAAEIDGAGAIKKFFYITLPMLRTIMLTVLMLTTIWTINYFPLIYIMTNGGPNGATETMVTYVYKVSFQYLKIHEASAMSTILLVIIGSIAFIYMYFINRKEART